MASLLRTLTLAKREARLVLTGPWARRSTSRALLQARERSDFELLQARVDRCILLRAPFRLDRSSAVAEFMDRSSTSYYLDLKELVRGFAGSLPLAWEFGDGIGVPDQPVLRKARRMGPGEERTVLLRLNSVRHFRFARDRRTWREKADRAVWRGKVNVPWREALVRLHDRDPRFDIGQTGGLHENGPWCKPRLSIGRQLESKFVLSVMGNDVATNLKWILSSNSLCVMPRPTVESWFLESWLRPGVHYAEVADDFSNLSEVLDHYLAHPDEAESIVRNARAHARMFMDPAVERLVGLLVLERWFDLARVEPVPDPLTAGDGRSLQRTSLSGRHA